MILVVLAIIYFGIHRIVSYFFDPFGANDKTYSRQELIENFNAKQKEIYAAKHYFESIVLKGKKVDIEFDGDRITRLEVYPTIDNAHQDRYAIDDSRRIDSIITALGWTKASVNKLRQKLEEANCISIFNDEPATIGFKRSGMGIYSFQVFDKPMADSTKIKYSRDSCLFIVANNRLVLEYGGGAIGPQCFPRKDLQNNNSHDHTRNTQTILGAR
ncbi:hypothetical protein [Mucilaginibacter pankratovii]|nr:hypothetical protein [Mucilaginibacter pankratovii]